MRATSSGLVVCFNVAPEKYETLERICRKNGLRIRSVPKEQFDQPLAAHFEIELPESMAKLQKTVENPDFDEELLVLHIFKDRQFNQFMADCRMQDATVKLKAVLTGTNSLWQPAALVTELKVEAAAMAEAIRQQNESVEPPAPEILKKMEEAAEAAAEEKS